MDNKVINLVDNDLYFKIEPESHAVFSSATNGINIVQYDHNSEIFTFEIPRYVEGHDMARCNAVRIHYTNIDGATKRARRGVYEVTDFPTIEPGDDSDTLVFSWVLSRNATMYAGVLAFVVSFVIYDETTAEVEYSWNTTTYEKVTVRKGIDNGEPAVDYCADFIEAWKKVIEAEALALVKADYKWDGTVLSVTNQGKTIEADLRGPGVAIRYATDINGTGMTEQWREDGSLTYIGWANQIPLGDGSFADPDNAAAYSWSQMGQGPVGEPGAPGKDGKDGLIPYIKDDNWWIGETDTGVKAKYVLTEEDKSSIINILIQDEAFNAIVEETVTNKVNSVLGTLQELLDEINTLVGTPE